MTQNKSVEEKANSEEWGAWKFVSEMLDTPHPDETLAKCGIYNTSKCYEQIHDFVIEQKEKVRQTSQEREREIVVKILNSYSPDDTVNDYQDKIKEIAQKYNITLTNPNKD